jgi:hypothetical protein
MAKRVVFAGGAQIKAFAKAYRLDVGLDRDDDVYFISPGSILRESAQRVVAAADILVTDLTLVGPTVPDHLVSVGTLRIAVPVVSGEFLWPYAGRAHPRNAPAPGLPDGPYPADFGDSFLDSMAANGVSDDDAVRRYLDLDIAEDAGLDGRLRMVLAMQEKLDAESGFNIAPFIAAHFRTEPLFATRERLGMPLFRYIAAGLFGQMGIRAHAIANLSDTFFPTGCMPIHPGILRHFRMFEPAPDHLYPMLDEGAFSFEQYCRRYLRYEWNKLLHAAIALVESDPAEAVPALRLALETSPLSSAGLRALKDAERALAEEAEKTPKFLGVPAEEVANENDAEAAHPALPAPEKVLSLAAPGAAASAVSAPLALTAPVSLTTAAATAPAALVFDPLVAEEGQAPPLLTIRRPSAPPMLRAADPDEAGPRNQLILTEHRSAFEPLDEEDEDDDGDSPRALLPPFDPHAWDPPELTEFERFHDKAEAEGPPLRLNGPGAEAMTALVEDVAVGQDALPFVPAQQDYVELPHEVVGRPTTQLPLPVQMSVTNRYMPLPPNEQLIKVLPLMLPHTRSLAGVADPPFASMPETMPPPPLRPVLPPELHPELPRGSLLSKLNFSFRRH